MFEILQPYIDNGLVRRQYSADGELVIYNYTEHCQYSRQWDGVTRMCRGLILWKDGRVVARPFDKFFNYGEPGCAEPPRGLAHPKVYEKIDGSLGIFYFWNGQWRVATRGSFLNVYTEYASSFLHLLDRYPKTWTVLAEIVLPKGVDPMPRCVAHEPGLHILGARETQAGTHIPYECVAAIWEGHKIEVKPDRMSPASAHMLSNTTEQTEGWVLCWDDGTRIKVKTPWYLRLFRAVSDLSEKRIKELLLESTPDRVIAEFPEEFRDEAEQLVKGVWDRYLLRWDELHAQLERLQWKQVAGQSRKELALSIQDNPDKSFLFMMLDGKDIREKLIYAC
jgi:RNA ligase